MLLAVLGPCTVWLLDPLSWGLWPHSSSSLSVCLPVESTSHFERRPQIPCRVFADPPGRRGGGGIGSSAVHIRSRSARLSVHDFIECLTGEPGLAGKGELMFFCLSVPAGLFLSPFSCAQLVSQRPLGLWSAVAAASR